MPSIPNRPNMPGGGWRQQRAAQLRSEAEAKERIQRASAEGQAGLGDDRMHCVQEGETIESIADSHNCSPESIRNHPSNAELSSQDDDACTLTPGDNVYIPAEDEQPPTPVGQGEHIVQQGECISSIAKDTGHFWKTIWKDSANAELREVRQDPNVLLPGDRVTIPEKRRKEEPRDTEQRHRFVRRGQPAMLRVRVLEHNKPRANEEYVVKVGGNEFNGITDPEGKIQCLLSSDETQAELIVGTGRTRRRHMLNLGYLAPVESNTGVQQRLTNLGFRCGRIDGNLGAMTRRALCAFQNKYAVAETGAPDQATLDRLKVTHGS